MQWFDEMDYDQSKFISTEEYDDQEEASRAAKDYAFRNLYEVCNKFSLSLVGKSAVYDATAMTRRWIDA